MPRACVPYVGTYCSSSVLGVCVTKRKTYCCFEIQALAHPAGAGPRAAEEALGQTEDRTNASASLSTSSLGFDLSQMDFSEVYAEFTDAARLPDELQAATDIQQKIEDYYAHARN